jgi:hypothetical protein
VMIALTSGDVPRPLAALCRGRLPAAVVVSARFFIGA